MKKKGLRNLLSIVVLAGLLVLVKELSLVSTSRLLILQYIAIYSIMVLGVNIVNGYLGIFSLAHAGFMAVGAYAAALSTRYFFTAQWMFPLALLFGGLVAMCIGLLVAIPSFKSRGDYLAIITLGFTLMVQSILQNAEFVGASRGMNNIAKFTNIYWVFGALVFAVYVVTRFINSKYGRSLKAIREDQLATELVSVNVRRSKTVAFALSAFLIGISGALLCHLLGYTSPSAYGYTNVVDGLVMVYIGGVGSVTGSIAGAAIWQILVQTLKDLGTWRWVVGGLLLCIVMIFLPKGIFGHRELGSALAGLKDRLTGKHAKEGGEHE